MTHKKAKALRRLLMEDPSKIEPTLFRILDKIVYEFEKTAYTPVPTIYCEKCGSHGMCHFTCENY